MNSICRSETKRKDGFKFSGKIPPFLEPKIGHRRSVDAAFHMQGEVSSPTAMSSADEARPVLALIDSLVANLVRDFAEGRIDGAIVMIARTKANTAFATSGAVIAGPATSQRKFSIRSLASLARLFAVISACYELLCKNKIVSQRQLYYMLVHLFPSQYALNDTVLDVSATLAVPRYALNVGAATRGVVAGSVCIGVPQSRVDVDCRFVGSVRSYFLPECIFFASRTLTSGFLFLFLSTEDRLANSWAN